VGQLTTSADDSGISIMASGPRDRERKGEGGDGRGWSGDDNAVSTWPHMTARERTRKRGTTIEGGRASDGNKGGGVELTGVGYAGGVSPRR
jgi:hypothetical protein